MSTPAPARQHSRGGRSNPLLARVILGVCVVGEFALTVAGVHGQRSHLLAFEALGVAVFGVALLSLRAAGLPLRAAVWGCLAVGVILQVAAVSGPPVSSDDVYRYVFDGKVQLAGIDPYRYAPADPALARLRVAPLFAPAGPECTRRLSDNTCSALNRPKVHTIYPPVAEAAFTLTRLLSGQRSDSPFPLQLLAAASVIAVSLLLARQVLRRRAPPWQLAAWAWCPVTVFELGNNAHVDGLATAFSLAAVITAAGGSRARNQSRRALTVGVLLALAVLTKLYPALLLAALWQRGQIGQRRRWAALIVRTPSGLLLAALVGTCAVAYAPHLAAVGTSVIGYLPGYLHEENYASGRRFLLLGWLPAAAAGVLAVAIVLGAAALALARRLRGSDADRPELTAVWLVGVALLVTTPGYAWYTVLLLGLVALSGRWEWLGVVLAPTFALDSVTFAGIHSDFRTAYYAAGLLMVLAGTAARRRHRFTIPIPATIGV